MTKKIIKISELENNYIERLFYEYNASLNILRYLTSQDDIRNNEIKMYYDIAEEKYLILELGKKELVKRYISEDIKNFSYTFDFDNQSIVLYLGEIND